MAQPVWVTPSGSLGTIPEGVFFQLAIQAYDPDQPNNPEVLHYEVIAGSLPPGIQCEATGLIIGVPRAVASVQGVPLEVSRDVTSKFAARVFTTNPDGTINRLSDRTFTLTVTGQDAPEWITPAGQITQIYDGSLVPGIQLEYTDTDPSDTVVVKLVAGNLPPGLTLSSKGLISGFVAPNATIQSTAGFSRDGQGYDMYPFDFSTQSIDYNYQFVLEVTDGKASNLRTFSIFVYSRSTLTADNDALTADNTFITADGTPIRVPIILNTQGSIGSIRSDNFFAYQFNGLDLDGDQFEFTIFHTVNGLPVAGSGIPGTDGQDLPLDPRSGWLYGYIPNLGIRENIYDFSIRVYKKDNLDIISDPYNYSLTVTGPIDSEIVWLTDSDLGTIVNGSTSTLYVKAVNLGGLELQYELLSGSTSNLPQGLELLPSGDIAGRVSFDTFALDMGATTFDVTMNDLGFSNEDTKTTFDLTHTFTVTAYSTNGVVQVNKVFSITVDRVYNEPYENLYIQCMPPQEDRSLLDGLLQDADIFQPSLIYRPQDPNFGIARTVFYNHAYGLTASTIADYYSSLYENHYWKNLVLGEIKTAQARDAEGNVIYEVIYSEVIDNLTNNEGESVSKQVPLAYPIDAGESTEIATVYPNSLVNMRDQVIDTVGQISNLLPTWMLSKQADGRVLGFTPSWVIAYTKPGQASRIAYYIRTQFGQQLNLVDFEVDRYELDRALTKNWDPATFSLDIVNVEVGVDEFTVEYAEEFTPPFVPGENVTITNVDPITYNGGYYVVSCTKTQVVLAIPEEKTLGIYVSGGTVNSKARWVPTPPSYTTFDTDGVISTWVNSIAQPRQWYNNNYDQGQDDFISTWTTATPPGTVFDGDSLKFITPVDMYATTTGYTSYDKYLVFPKRNILE
jgi:hypothetical protein